MQAQAQAQTLDPFGLTATLQGPMRRRLFSWLEAPLSPLLGTSDLRRMYADLKRTPGDQPFPENALAQLQIDCRISPEDQARIPATGPLVVVANHPFGMPEGMAIVSILRTVRSDIKIMANGLITRFPEMQDLIISVDPFGGAAAARHNSRGLRDSIQWVKRGGVLVIFPAGAVAHIDWRQRRVTDRPWSASIGRLIRRMKAPVLPVYFPGRNPAAILAPGLLHPRLRTLMLGRQLLGRRGKSLEPRVGTPLSAGQLEGVADDAELTRYLRFRTYLLAHRGTAPTATPTAAKAKPPAVAAGPPADDVAREIEALPERQCLLTSGEFQVCYARAEQIPTLLQEIGRLREITFRANGEGTGREIDLDSYDEYYVHLFVWNREERDLVGAYRLGHIDKILAHQGLEGLYTTHLFGYRRELFDRLGPALELGRSFVQPKYQRKYASLLLLWKGIGHYVAQNPRYKMLLGAVSISNDYQGVSRQLIMDHLLTCETDEELAALTRPAHPFRRKSLGEADPGPLPAAVRNMAEVSAWVEEIEPDHRGVPILVKHYLKLGAKVIAGNVDPAFSNVLDGLILVDFTRTEAKMLGRYMGKDGAQSFLDWHQREGAPAATSEPEAGAAQAA